MITELAAGDGTIEIAGIEPQVSLDDLAEKLEVSRRFIASFLYYLGLLTLVGDPPRQRLGVPNLVAKRCFDRFSSSVVARGWRGTMWTGHANYLAFPTPFLSNV